MKSTLIAMIIAAFSVAAMPAIAQDAAPAKAKPVAKASKAKAAKKPPEAVEEDEKEPEVTGTNVTDYQCELGAKLTVFQNVDDDKHIALKWGKRVHQMDRVDTTTGANRFENRHYGLVWIGIPTKAILLDSKSGHQLANECKTAEQRMASDDTQNAPVKK
ncbi:MAG TPA: hypothetical protein VIF60_16495 [Burkholderiaceae bacterium]